MFGTKIGRTGTQRDRDKDLASVRPAISRWPGGRDSGCGSWRKAHRLFPAQAGGPATVGQGMPFLRQGKQEWLCYLSLREDGPPSLSAAP